MERELIWELSQYYPLGHGRSLWKRPSLLPLGKHVIAQHTMTFHSPEFLSVVKDLEDFFPFRGHLMSQILESWRQRGWL